MTTEQLILSVLSLASGALGWFARELWTAVSLLKTDISNLRAELPRAYVARDDYRADIRELKEMLGKIFDRLEGKADKT